VVPSGIRLLANWVKKQYGDVPIYFTESGVSDNTGTLEDHARIDYLQSYTNEVMKGVGSCKINIDKAGYDFHWGKNVF